MEKLNAAVLDEEQRMMDDLHAKVLSDEELLGFALDGEELPEKAREHLEQCETCQRRLARYQQANNFLVSHLYRSQCPTAMKLSYYCAGGLSGDERLGIARHLQVCPLCAAEAAETRRFLQEDVELPAPAFSPRAAVRRIFATLVQQQPQLVLRSDAPQTGWPRQYKAESIDLSLHLSRTSSGAYMLLGILTSADSTESVDVFEGVRAELYAAPGPLSVNGNKQTEVPVLSTQVDDLGNIVFSAVPEGEYVLVVHLPDRELVVNGLIIEHM